MKTRSKRVTRWRVVVAALCLFTAPAGTGVSLPESVLPCLPCHHRGNSDQVGEWLASPYSEAQGGRGCTDCHDPNCAGNGERSTLAATGPRRWREAVGLSVTAVCSGNGVDAEVAVSNVGVGHLLPTGSEGRTLVLEVAARDRHGTPLSVSSTTVQPPLAPFATDVSRHRLVAPANGAARISARLFLVPAAGPRSEIAGTETFCNTSKETR